MPLLLFSALIYPELGFMSQKKPPQPSPSKPQSSGEHFVFFRRILLVIWDIFLSLRVLLFVAYVLTAVLRFWIWFLEKVLATIRILIRFLTVPLGTLSGLPYSASIKADENNFFFKSLWANLYFTVIREFYDSVRDTVIVIWESIFVFAKLSVSRKIVVLVIPFLLVIGPLGFIIPRSAEVKIISINSIRDNIAMAGNESYVILTKGFEGEHDFRQFVNKDAWWLTKVNSQRLKTILKEGKTYEIWYVGYRIVFPFEMYPNMVYAVELEDGRSKDGDDGVIKDEASSAAENK